MVRDAASAAATLAGLIDVTVVTDRPCGPVADEETIDLVVGGAGLRLVSPRSPASRYAGVLGDRGGRLHALCFEVRDLDDALAAMPGHGISVTGRAGPIAWTDPATTVGLPLEWVQR